MRMSERISGNGTEPITLEISHKQLRRRDYKGTRHRDMQEKEFIAWDGEGYTDGTENHHYNLFGASTGDYVRADSLDYHQCFRLLFDVSGATNGIHCIYGGDYDVIMMTKGMPFPVKDRLLKGLPVKYGGYRMHWFRRKMLRLKQLSTGKTLTLYDVISFFQTSFVKACIEYLGDSPELQRMQQMKLRRDAFTPDDPDVIPYWQSELDHLVRLMTRLRELLREVGIYPSSWHGPGAVASALLKQRGISEHLVEPPEHIVDLAERAYYGGRFEQFRIGRFRDVHQYDIRSAYPRAITLLPSLQNVRWKVWSRSSGAISNHGLYKVSWNIPFRPWQIGPLPWRDSKGNVFFPLEGYKSWYWGIEVQNLLQYPSKYWTIHEGWEMEFDRTEYPFDWVEEMYDDRARMKAEGNPAQLAMKLGLNSLYGKLAQSRGAVIVDDEWKKPRWHSAIWASWITAYTRRQIFEAAYKVRNKLVAIETDGIFVSASIPDLHVSTSLGDWEETQIADMLYVQSGVYYALKDDHWKSKSRGVESDAADTIDTWMAVFDRLPHTKVELTARIRRFGTVLRSKHYGNWFDYSRSIKLPAYNSKRIHHPELCIACNLRAGSFGRVPHNLAVPGPRIDADITTSTPYPFPWRPDRTQIDFDDIPTERIEKVELEWQTVSNFP